MIPAPVLFVVADLAYITIAWLGAKFCGVKR